MSVYKEYIILAFRYTNTALNVWQDILYPLQVKIKFIPRLKTNILVVTVKFKKLILTCGNPLKTKLFLILKLLNPTVA